MSWQLFVVLQTAIFSGAVIAALWLHIARLRRQNDELTRLCLAAHEELVNVTGKLSAIETTAPPEKMLEQRLKGLSGDESLTVVRRLVLENEIRPMADFEEQIMSHLAVEEPEEQEFVSRWKSIRAECQQLALFLIADNPSAHTAITQLFEVIQPLDELYGVQLEPLLAPQDDPDEAPDASAGDGPGPGTSAESESAGGAEAAGSDDEELDQDALDALLASAQSGSAGDSARPGNA